MKEQNSAIRFWFAVSSICIILCTHKICPAANLYTNFDSLSEGNYGSTFTDGGITFSNFDDRDDTFPSSDFYIDYTDVQYISDFTPPNFLGFWSAPGPGWGLARFGSADISFDIEASQASMLILYPGGDGPNTDTYLQLEALLDGEVVASSIFHFVGYPYEMVKTGELTVSAPKFDSLHLSVYNISGAESIAGIGIDNVSITEVPEPASALLIGAGLLFVRLRRR